MPDFDDGFQPAPLPLASDNQATIQTEETESWDLLPPPGHAAIAAGLTPEMWSRYGRAAERIMEDASRLIQAQPGLTPDEEATIWTDARRALRRLSARTPAPIRIRPTDLQANINRAIQQLATRERLDARRQANLHDLATRYAARMAARGVAIDVAACVAQAALAMGIGGLAGHVAGQPGLTVAEEAALGGGSVAAAALAGAAIGSVVPGPGTAAGAAIAAAAAALGGGTLVMGTEAYLEAEAATQRTADVERRQQALRQLSPPARRASVRRPGIRGELMVGYDWLDHNFPDRTSLLAYADALGLGWPAQLPTLELRDTILAELKRRWAEEGLGPFP